MIMKVSAVLNAIAFDARVLERAERVLITLRGCGPEAAFTELVEAAKRHRVPARELASALVALANGADPGGDAACAARYEWSALLSAAGR
nr:ANTAR domain-containing protein [Mycolicibacterium komanii]CRL68691.1 ANTAR domain-containing protein [Mycolicibacterium komanii]